MITRHIDDTCGKDGTKMRTRGSYMCTSTDVNPLYYCSIILQLLLDRSSYLSQQNPSNFAFSCLSVHAHYSYMWSNVQCLLSVATHCMHVLVQPNIYANQNMSCPTISAIHVENPEFFLSITSDTYVYCCCSLCVLFYMEYLMMMSVLFQNLGGWSVSSNSSSEHLDSVKVLW